MQNAESRMDNEITSVFLFPDQTPNKIKLFLAFASKISYLKQIWS